MDTDSGDLSEGELSPGPEAFSSKSFAVQAQKKILGKMATKTMANMLIDDTSSEVFDELFKATKEYMRNKKEAHKVLKDLIKVAVKVGILYRNNQFSPEELEIVEKFRKRLNQTAMTAVSFYEVEYTFDKNVLSGLLQECKTLLHDLVQRHLTPKSHGRIDRVFNHFSDVEFLTSLYSPDGTCRPYLKRICEGVNKLLDEKILLKNCLFFMVVREQDGFLRACGLQTASLKHSRCLYGVSFIFRAWGIFLLCIYRMRPLSATINNGLQIKPLDSGGPYEME